MDSKRNDRIEKSRLTKLIAATKQTFTEQLPKLAGTAAKGLVPLSLGLALVHVIQSAPQDVFVYLAGLAPNFISEMLSSMRRGEKQPDAETIAAAVAQRLNDPGVRQLADELEVLQSLASAMEVIQVQSRQLQQLSQRFTQEMHELKVMNWPIPEVTEITIDMLAQGQNIAQAKVHSIAVVANAPVNINQVNQSMERFVSILVSNPGSELLAERQTILGALAQVSLPDFLFKVTPSQSVSLREAHHAVEVCDIYIGLLGAGSKASLTDDVSIIEAEIQRACERNKVVIIYCQETGATAKGQPDLINRLEKTGCGYIHKFDVFDAADEWGKKAKNDIIALLPQDFKARKLPTSNRRGLIASLGRSPGAVTGLFYALNDSKRPINYVWTISTTDPEVSRAVTAVRNELKSFVDYEDVPIKVTEFTNDQDVIKFKQAFVNLLHRAKSNGDAIAIGVTGGRSVMGALLTQVAQMEAPANSAFYQLSVPASIEDDGRYPRFGNQSEEDQKKLLNPKAFFPDLCHLLEISFNHFYDDVYEGF